MARVQRPVADDVKPTWPQEGERDAVERTRQSRGYDECKFLEERERERGWAARNGILWVRVARRVKITTVHFACQTYLSFSLSPSPFHSYLSSPSSLEPRISLLSSPIRFASVHLARYGDPWIDYFPVSSWQNFIVETLERGETERAALISVKIRRFISVDRGRKVLFFTGGEVRLGWRYKSVRGGKGKTCTLKLRSGLSATPKFDSVELR